MTHDDVQRWLDRYVEGWRTYDPEIIGGLFAENATYRYHPWDAPFVGREAIVRSWVEPVPPASGRDDPRSWRASYHPLAIEGDLVLATGTSEYLDADGNVERTYRNLWVMRFDEHGRCTDYTEWFMTPPES